MKNRYFILLILISLVFFMLIVLDSFTSFYIAPEQNKFAQVIINENTIDIEIAMTEQQRKLGLGNRESLAKDSGMLFVFEQRGIHSMWMKGMDFPLDVIWISDNKVIDLAQLLPVVKNDNFPVIKPCCPADYLLEVNAGYVAEHNIKIGDSVDMLF